VRSMLSPLPLPEDVPPAATCRPGGAVPGQLHAGVGTEPRQVPARQLCGSHCKGVQLRQAPPPSLQGALLPVNVRPGGRATAAHRWCNSIKRTCAHRVSSSRLGPCNPGDGKARSRMQPACCVTSAFLLLMSPWAVLSAAGGVLHHPRHLPFCACLWTDGLLFLAQVESYITRDTTFSRIMQGQALNQHRLLEGNLAAFGYKVGAVCTFCSAWVLHVQVCTCTEKFIRSQSVLAAFPATGRDFQHCSPGDPWRQARLAHRHKMSSTDITDERAGERVAAC
jgi:hypothetical protein